MKVMFVFRVFQLMITVHGSAQKHPMNNQQDYVLWHHKHIYKLHVFTEGNKIPVKRIIY